jgi:ribulose-5-phosphate 4-epimerase/fuculose-1-phosphate aldolase
MNRFIEENKEVLENYVCLSVESGSRSDYVQGGGGNTSCKFDDRRMAIKASGYRLSQIAVNDGYAVLDYATIVEFYRKNTPQDLVDVEKSGSEAVKSAVCEIDGIPSLRPSVEAGFHSLLNKYVLHTHPVYANFAACSAEGRQIAARALSHIDYSYGFVPYVNPGAQLTFEINKEMQRVKSETGRYPAAIIMQNHGLIATSDDPRECLAIHEEVNRLIAGDLGITQADFPSIGIRKSEQNTLSEKGGPFFSDTPWLLQRINNPKYDLKFFCEDALYPDQLVFLEGNMVILDEKIPDNPSDWGKGKCIIYRKSNHILYNCSYREAKTIEETLCAVVFIVSTIDEHGYTVNNMSDSSKNFIANWEGEKYRKSIDEKR